jgi:hypothetical protein
METTMQRLLAFLAVLLFSACTTSLKVQRVDPAKPETRVGAPYPLLFTRYEIEITRQVAGCGPKVKVLVKAEIKGAEGTPDPKQLFVLDPNSLASPVKTSEVKLEYLPNGAISSLNASAEDRSAQVISNVVATAVKVVPLLAAAGAPPGVVQPDACSNAVLNARKIIIEKTPIMEVAVKLVDSRSEEVKTLNNKIASMGSNVDERTKASLSRAYDALVAAQGDLSDIQSVLEKALKVITYVETIRWPDNGDMSDGEAQIPRAVLSRWGADNQPNSLKEVAVFFNLAGIGVISRDMDKEDVVDPKLGVPFRQPVLGRLMVCTGGKCSTDNLPIAEKVGDVLQLGYVYYLPCESRPFTSISCSFAMNDAGQLKSMGTMQKAASAEGLSGATKDTVTQIGSLQESLASAKTKKLEAQTAALKAQADYAAAAAALQPDPSKPDKEETAALKASTDLLDAKRAQLEAEAALTEAQTKAGKVGP